MRLFYDPWYWVQVKAGNEVALSIFQRHYSRYEYKDGRRPKLFVGPGEKMVLLGKGNDALFVWRKFRSADGQVGINCAVFRNESDILSSDLLQQAEEIAESRWPGERFYTYINPLKIKSVNPGYCFKINGWRKCGITKKRKLLILEKFTMKYVIISLTHGTGKEPAFWRANASGYTNYPFNAGQYDEATINSDPGYYNNGHDTIAIPLTDAAMDTLGFKCSYLERALVNFKTK